MGSFLKTLDFEGWVKYVFDHPVSKPAWYHKLNRDFWDDDASPSITLSFLTRLFENAHENLAPFSDAQVNQGLWFLVDPSCSNHFFAVKEYRLPQEDRKRCIEGFNVLYEQVFAKRCTSHLSHMNEEGRGPLNSVCYMWWDIIPLFGDPEDGSLRLEIDHLCLNVMEQSLKLNSIACRESALHGLGHWHRSYPQRVETIIDQFLDKHEKLPPELSAYARAARQGGVL